MPLTPAEVHNVAFKKPPIGKRGYDEEEVDAFLDIVEVELARLIEENNDLRAHPAAGANGGANPAELAGLRDENSRLKARVSEMERTIGQGNDVSAQQVMALRQQLAQTEHALAQSRQDLQQAQQAAAAAQQAAAKAAEGSTASSDVHSQAVQVLALAQQTADAHLAQSKAEAERLLAEAQANAQAALNDAKTMSQKHLSEAQTQASAALRDAEQRASTITAQFEQRREALERRVEQLRTFEREYRTRLKSYLESQLRDLDASGRAEPVQAGQPQREVAPAAQG